MRTCRLLIGLEILRSGCLVLNTDINTLEWRMHQCISSITYRLGHAIFNFISNFILDSRRKLKQLNHHFIHPSVDKLMCLLKRAFSTKNVPDNDFVVQWISDACRTCPEYEPHSLRFCASIVSDTNIFNHELAIDMMIFWKRTNLTCCRNTYKFPECRLPTFDISTRCMECVHWILGYSIRMIPKFHKFGSKQQPHIKFLLRSSMIWHLHGISIQFSCAQCHNTIGNDEWYNEPLRWMFTKRQTNEMSLDPESLLWYSRKALKTQLKLMASSNAYLSLVWSPSFQF